MSGHLHVLPEDRVEAQCVARLLKSRGIEVRIGSEDCRDVTACRGGVLLLDCLTAVEAATVTKAVLHERPLVVVVDQDSPEAEALALRRPLAELVAPAAPSEVLVATAQALVAGDLVEAGTGVPLSTCPPSHETVLTQRELQVADMLAGGLRNDEIAERLEISSHTVRTHVQHVLTKLDVPHRVALAAQLHRNAIPYQRRSTGDVSGHGAGA